MKNIKAGRELDALVAEKVMGWRREEGCPWWIHEDDKGHGEQVDRWSPSTDIAAAMEIVNARTTKLGKESFSLQSPHDQTKKWFACFERKWAGHAFQEYYEWSSAETAPHAICIAALKAVGTL